jgi:hypothetical protein
MIVCRLRVNWFTKSLALSRSAPVSSFYRTGRYSLRLFTDAGLNRCESMGSIGTGLARPIRTAGYFVE